MKTKEQLCIDVFSIAKDCVASVDLLDFSLKKGRELAEFYHVSSDIVFISMCLMDLKLQDAKSLGKIEEHVAMSLAFAEEFLKEYDLTEIEYEMILSCIRTHHGSSSFSFKEAEVVANADCYLFIHPEGVFRYFSFLSRRHLPLCEQVDQMKYKLEEKYQALSLEKAKEELTEYYQIFIKLFEVLSF